MSKTKQRNLRVRLAFSKANDAALLSRGQAVVNGMTGNPAYTNPPVDPVALKTTVDNFAVAMGDAADGGKKARAERDRQRDSLVGMLRRLAQYVEAECGDDLSKLLSSGFEAMTPGRTPVQPLEPATIKSITQGTSGQLLVRLKNISQAWSYELRVALLDANGTPGQWTSHPVTTVAAPVSFAGLTPGSTYAFQARALGRLGYSDWSQSVARMCI